jgi:hypothetical protein
MNGNCGFCNRREALQSLACGFGYLALAGIANEANASANPLAPKQPHLTPKAKRVIFIFMQGGPSQVDSFDPKPKLDQYNGEKIDFHVARTREVTPEKVMKSPWGFKQYGECGQWVSDLFPEQAKLVDELCVIRSMHTEGVAHGPATLFLHTGATNLIRPSVGAWVMYGLGTENQNLPGFVTINPPMSKGGPRNYSNAFLPTVYQGTTVGRAGSPTSQAKFRYVNNDTIPADHQREQLDFLQSLNHQQQVRAGDDELEAVINSYELAYRMQSNAPGIMDISEESQATLDMYGINSEPTDDFGRQCLMARRLAEADVRYIQINYSDNSPTPMWDQHSNIMKHADHAKATDKPVAGLLRDLKQRGLLEDTLVWWGGEFGRTPYAQGADGRDHNPNGFTVWLAGGGVKPGFCYGDTDEFGYHAINNKVHMHDLHATILHQLGLNHEQLTYRYAGRDFRLTDVYGHVVKDIIA